MLVRFQGPKQDRRQRNDRHNNNLGHLENQLETFIVTAASYNVQKNTLGELNLYGSAKVTLTNLFPSRLGTEPRFVA
jgi:hypothetical protein